jgi:hypothetical protein
MSQRLTRHFLGLSPALLAVTFLTFVGCDGNQQPKQPGESAAYKPTDSVYREVAPGARSAALQAHLNQLRRETYNITTGDYDVNHSDAVYTAAYRHAVYLNTYNSAGWDALTNSGTDLQLLNSVDSTLGDLLGEDVLPVLQYPALVTGQTPYQRIAAIRNGSSVLSTTGSDPRLVSEMYVFNGDIWRTDGGPSRFRGYNKDTLSDADPTKYAFDEIDCVWYSRYGRISLMRPALRYFGYGNRADSGQIPTVNPPFPIFNNRFLGVMNGVESAPLVARAGHWPTVANTGTNGVHPYGMDTDIGGPNQYAGPPIHFTLPVDEPFLRDVGISLLNFGRTDGIDPAAPPHNSPAWRQFRVFSNVSGLVVPTIPAPAGGQYRANGTAAPVVVDAAVLSSNPVGWNAPPTAQTYSFTLAATVDMTAFAAGDTMTVKISAGNPGAGSYTFTIASVIAASHVVTFSVPVGTFGAGIFPAQQLPPSAYGNDITNVTVDITSTVVTNVTTTIDEHLRNGELVLVPVAPLQNNTQYTVTARFRTPSYDSGLINFTFTTDSTGIYP